MDLLVDEKRSEQLEETPIGIYVRVKNQDGTYGSADISHLTPESVIEWAKGLSKEGLIRTILVLLGHPPDAGMHV
jgi:hypothetical protein